MLGVEQRAYLFLPEGEQQGWQPRPVSFPMSSRYNSTNQARCATFSSAVGGASIGSPRTSFGIPYSNVVSRSSDQCSPIWSASSLSAYLSCSVRLASIRWSGSSRTVVRASSGA
jgi:hypothetical protein